MMKREAVINLEVKVEVDDTEDPTTVTEVTTYIEEFLGGNRTTHQVGKVLVTLTLTNFESSKEAL